MSFTATNYRVTSFHILSSTFVLLGGWRRFLPSSIWEVLVSMAFSVWARLTFSLHTYMSFVAKSSFGPRLGPNYYWGLAGAKEPTPYQTILSKVVRCQRDLR